jgi:hypothetical protein
VLKPLARKLLKVLRMVATYEPQAGTQQQTFTSVREKMAASSRARPSTLQLLFSFSRRARELLTGGARRPGPDLPLNAIHDRTHVCSHIIGRIQVLEPRSLPQILADLIKEYNKKTAVTVCKINLDEERGIKFLARRGEGTLRQIKLAWARERVQYSAIPMNLLGSSFLDDTKELPVSQQQNPRWATILQPTEVLQAAN